ncbi:hypothetical protein EG329_001273 [Mollisiaceae sp. DMI_Dod_QoI]|nr:hypothetical protein EG329_001273 [Helotiales sp. DMI_Dod_QoI]
MAVKTVFTHDIDQLEDKGADQAGRPYLGSGDEVLHSTTPLDNLTESTATSANKTQLPLHFINELQRQNSSQVKREIRSHVKKVAHFKQRKLNEASKAKPLSSSPRRILRKRVDAPSPLLFQGSAGLEQPLNPLSVADSAFHTSMSHGEAHRGQRVTAASSAVHLSRRQFNTTTPYALLLDDNAPILQLDGRRWPFPQPIQGNSPAASVWMPQKSIPIPNARSTRPCLLRSAQVVPWIANSVDYLTFKHEVIRWVNSKLLVADDATNDLTIGVIICLMSWEIARADVDELRLHMDGLHRILDLRRGLLNITCFAHFNWKIELIDLLVALLTSSEPRFDAQH